MESKPAGHYAQSGTYYVCLTISSDSGTTCNYCTTVTVNSNPTTGSCDATFTSGRDSSSQNTAWFYCPSPYATSWSWNFGDGSTSHQQYPSHHYAQAGTYNVCLSISTDSGLTTCSYCTSIVVGSNPNNGCGVGIQMWQDSSNAQLWYIYPFVTGTAPFTYNWSFGDGTSSTQAYPTHNYTTPGHYMICLTITDATGCSSSTCDSTYRLGNATMGGTIGSLVVVNSVSGIKENTLSGISVYPNPANDMIQVSLTEWEKGTITITDMTGRQVLNQNMNANNTQVNVRELPAGFYDLSFKTDTKIGHSKIMIVR